MGDRITAAKDWVTVGGSISGHLSIAITTAPLKAGIPHFHAEPVLTSATSGNQIGQRS